jgi:diguanylate cyclase (GGDEF)-like protein
VDIRKWLTGIVMFLLAPSLLFATLWIKNSLNDVRSIQRALAGLESVRAFSPVISQRLGNNSLLDAPRDFPFSNSDEFLPEERQRFQAAYSEFLEEPLQSRAIRRARMIVQDINQAVKLSSTTGFETARLPGLVSDTLLTVLSEASEMVRQGEQLSAKKKITLWDRMSVPVQGGQFKAAADEVDRVTKAYFEHLESDGSEKLKALALAYRRANGLYQNAGSNLLQSTNRADSGADISVSQARNALPHLVAATMALWDGSIDYLVEDLQNRRLTTVVSVVIAGIFGIGVILFASGMAFLFSRSVANRTLEEFHKLGFHDPLTGLPNRRGLMKTLDAIACTTCSGTTGLIVLDIRRFKAINHRFGDHVGDAALRQAAETIVKTSRPGDFIARTGGTEFMLLRRDIGPVAEFEVLAKRLTQEITRERIIDNHRIRLESCAGLSVTEPNAKPTENLLTDAALAMRAAKSKPPRTVCQFRPEMRDIFERNTDIVRDLQQALKENQIVPWYQPQISLHSGQVVGAEALVRWVDTERGVRFPGSFLPAAEEAGYMTSIDACVRKQAMEMTGRLLKENTAAFHMGLNVSAALLADPDCVDLLLCEVEAAGVTPDRISIEILEAVMIDAYAADPIKANVAGLSEHGFQIELDDFGTGHSSISSLRDLRVDRVKIDRSFVTGVDRNPELRKFTSALIQLARSLDIEVLAEGVETEGERNWLADNGCDALQGYLYSKAIPEKDFLALDNPAAPEVVPFPQKTDGIEKAS